MTYSQTLLRVLGEILETLLEIVGEMREHRQAINNLTARIEKLEKDLSHLQE